MGKFKDLRNQLNRAKELEEKLSYVAKIEDDLTSGVLRGINSAKEGRVLQKLAEIPIENLKDATTNTVRVETLKKYGFNNVAAIYHAELHALERISGISRESALELKSLANRIFGAIAENINYGIDVENISLDDEKVLSGLQGLEEIRTELRGNQKEIRSLVENLKEPLIKAKPLTSRVRWFLTKKENRNRALDAITNISFLMGQQHVAMVTSLAQDYLNHKDQKLKQPPIEDFKNKSADYYSILEDIGGARTEHEYDQFTQELIDAIEAESLDTKEIKATLRKYQVFGSKFALNRFRVILGDEMGLGKTLQAIATINQRILAGANRFLIVCPASVLVNWEREISKRSIFTAIKIHGENQKNTLAEWKEKGGIALTTFDTLKAFEVSDDEIVNLRVDLIVVDEAHYIKNVGIGRTKAITKWLDRTPRVLFMTGTPLENRIEEFINLAKLLDPKFAKNVDRAALRATPATFRKTVAPIYLRRNAHEVLNELPELIEIDELCSWEGADYESYLQAVIKGNFMGMRQAGMRPGPYGTKPNKLIRLLEIAEEAFVSGKKVIVFSYFKEPLQLVVDHLGSKALGPITGADSSAARQGLIDALNESKEPLALIGQIQAAGTGLNIQSASVVIICEPQIKPSLEKQAIARAHRMGQVNKVQVHRLIIEEGVDSLMQDMLKRKQGEFDTYVRDSELANSSSNAMDHDEENIAQEFIKTERERLNIKDEPLA